MSFTLIISLETRSPAGNLNKMRAWENSPGKQVRFLKTKARQAHRPHDPRQNVIKANKIFQTPWGLMGE